MYEPSLKLRRNQSEVRHVVASETFSALRLAAGLGRNTLCYNKQN